MQAWPRSAAARQKLLSEAKAFLFDCDGVIWRGNKLIEGIIKVQSPALHPLLNA